MKEDGELVQRFKNGELEAFEMLVKKYQITAVNIAYPLLNNRHDAEDIAQEAFIKVYQGIDSFRQDAQFSSWLYRIVVNTAYDFLRRKRYKAVSLDEIDYASVASPEKEEDFSAQELIRTALLKIPFAYRSALVLREIVGLSYAEIAQTLKINIGTVESRIYRARALLKKILLEKGGLKNEL